MTFREPDPPDQPDGPTCPLLGLADDPRTRYTFPHPHHRCHAGRRPRTVDRAHQSTYCLALGFASCERYRSHLPRPVKSRSELPPAPAVSAPSIVHVFRVGDSLVRIASAYGVTVEQLVAANNLVSTAAIEDGQRLRIPLARPPEGGPPGAAPWADRSG